MLHFIKICGFGLIAAFFCFFASVAFAAEDPPCNPACTGGEICAKGKCVLTTGGGPANKGAITGCKTDFGLFSGLINTGREVFSGLRDLIYVVAGFGIIGVAVGGFFGNLNWKWMGAIIIGLVVIATTGEIINAITGCENFTTAMIEDTLK